MLQLVQNSSWMNCHVLTVHTKDLLHEVWEVSRDNEYLRDREKRHFFSYSMLFSYWKNFELSLAYYLQMHGDIRKTITWKKVKISPQRDFLSYFLLSTAFSLARLNCCVSCDLPPPGFQHRCVWQKYHLIVKQQLLHVYMGSQHLLFYMEQLY